MDHALVDARAIPVPDRGCVGVSEREVARRVLVEQCVEEGDARLPDPSLTVDERELAEPRRPLVLCAPGAQNVGARLRFDLDDASRLEADAQAAHDRAAYV